jgi:DNA replication protein DnaC
MNLSIAIDAIATASKQAIPIEDGDYIGEDGLYYCGKCNTPKQCRVKNPFVAGVYDIRHCMCECRMEEKRRKEEEAARIAFEKRVKEYRRVGFPDEKMQYWTFENDDKANEKISTVARNYFDNFDRMIKDGKGLLLFGKTGRGKSFAAACIANALIDKGYQVLMTNFARIRGTVQGMFDGRQEYLDSFNRFPLLILDDLSAESKSEYMQEIVYEVINNRYLSGLPLIVTTNLTADELKHPADMTNIRTFSRLFEMCTPIEVSGKDRRQKVLREDIGKMKSLLGLD